MRNILIIGAGRSASSLIQYLLNKSDRENLHLVIGDLSLELAKRKTNNHPNATPIQLDIFDEKQRQAEIQKALKPEFFKSLSFLTLTRKLLSHHHKLSKVYPSFITRDRTLISIKKTH